MNHYVYVLAYPDGKVFYVGKGSGSRIDAHEREAKRGATRNPGKVEAIKHIWAMGEDVVKTKLASFQTNDEASMYESALIFFMNDLTNIMPCKSGGHEHSPESIHKIREAATGRIFPEETRRKIAASLRGRTVSPEIRKTMSLAHKKPRRKSTPQQYPPQAKFGSIEHREKLRVAATGRPVSVETRQKLSQILKGRVREFSEEHRANLRRAAMIRRLKKQEGA